MSYTPYATAAEYSAMFPGAPETTETALRDASRHIDTLTFNRIVEAGFSNLTDFQQEIIKEVVCLQAKFESENEDLITSVLASYSINGVSMSFGQSWNVAVENGVAIQTSVLARLKQTGLCCRALR